MRILARIESVLLRQRGFLFPWVPVCMAFGIAWYFALPTEPGVALLVALCVLALSGSWVARRNPGAWTPLGFGLALVALGFGLAVLRAHVVAAPVLDWRYYGPVEGRVIGLDRSASDALRVTLDQVRLSRVAAADTPDRVRISLHGTGHDPLRPGQRVMTTAHLSPPQGPVEPGGFDFRRHAWFRGLGAVGYTRVPVLTVNPPADGVLGASVFGLRMALSEHVRSTLPGDVGGFAAAVTTGDRSGFGRVALETLRHSNLAHLLAISGLHMGLLTGFVFAMLRLGLCLFPALALRWPVKKIAACGALVTATFYLALSGGNVATERAFVMVAVMLGAVIADRRALSLRAVALAAIIVLALRPEALLSPGFQMSFAATTALVAAFGWLNSLSVQTQGRWYSAVLGVVISSAVAGLATSPVGAAHFNTMSHFGLPANLVSVPVMGLVVIPSAVLALLLAPFGLDWIGLHLMGLGLQWILAVAERVSSLPGAVGHVMTPPSAVLPLIALGGLFVILWRGWFRLAGLAPVALGFLLWSGAERPMVLIADSGKLVGVMTEKGRVLSRPKGSGFIAQVWLENDGDSADQVQAAARHDARQEAVWSMNVDGWDFVHIAGKRAAQNFADCDKTQIVVAAHSVRPVGGCRIIGADMLTKTGSLAFSYAGEITSAQGNRDRLWAKVQPSSDQ